MVAASFICNPNVLWCAFDFLSLPSLSLSHTHWHAHIHMSRAHCNICVQAHRKSSWLNVCDSNIILYYLVTFLTVKRISHPQNVFMEWPVAISFDEFVHVTHTLMFWKGSFLLPKDAVRSTWEANVYLNGYEWACSLKQLFNNLLVNLIYFWKLCTLWMLL